MKTGVVYILRCSDFSYYTGVSTNLEQRLYQHQSGVHDGYTSIRRPVELVWVSDESDIQEAIQLERQIKGWSRAKKEALIRGDFGSLVDLSKPYRDR